MGFWGDVGGRVRNLMSFDKERVVLNLAKGGTASGYPQTGFDLLQAYGYDVLSDYLKLEHDLMSRYVDYEEQDDYPELSCLGADSRVFTLEHGWERIEDLAQRGGEFHVLAYDKETKSLTPALACNARKTGSSGHSKPMVRIVFDNGQSITCTADHLFFTKDERWIEAGSLNPGQRLMPGVVRMRSLNTDSSEDYWQVHQPNSDSESRSSDGKRWTWIHRLVGEKFLGAGKGDVVHHRDENSLNNAPGNLSVEDRASHASQHIARIDNSHFFPEWTPKRRAETSKRMLGNSYKTGKKDSEETKQRKSDSAKQKKLSTEHKQRIGDAHRIKLTREQVEAAYESTNTVAEMAMKLDVSWSTARRNLDRFDLIEDDNNHRVIRVEYLGERDEIFDLEVPDYHNFVCDGVVVHNSAIDIYADDATQVDALKNRTVWVDSPDQTVQTILEDLFHRRLRIDEEIWEMARTLVKYGNDYEELLVTGDGVVGLNFLPPPTMRRIEGRRGELFGFVQDFKGRFGYSPDEFKQLLTQRLAGANQAHEKYAALEDWEVAHLRLRSKHRRSIYGYSVLESSRWIWKRLMLLEDAAMVYRLQRAPQRYAFYIDVGDLPPKEAFAFLHKVRQQYKKTKFYNPTTGKLDLKFNPLSQDDDFFVPVRKGVQQTKIEVVGSPSWQHMEDIEYFKLKLYAAIKVPKVYLGSEAPRAKGVLCLTGDTRVPLLDGRTVTLKDLTEEQGPDGTFYVYSCDKDGNIVPGEAVGCQMTRPNAEVWEVELDDGSKVRGTPDHPFMMRDGSYRELSELKSGDSLMPLYRKLSRGRGRGEKLDSYEMVQHPSTEEYEYTHQAVSRSQWGDSWYTGGGEQCVCHHASFDKMNNDPRFLRRMTKEDHFQLHAEHAEKTLQRPDVVEARRRGVKAWTDTERCKELAKANLLAAQPKVDAWRRSDEHRFLKSEQMTRQWADEDSSILAAHTTDEFRSHMSDVAKQNWSDPEYREQREGENNGRWRHDVDLQHLIETADSYRCRNRDELIKWSKCSWSLIARIFKQNGTSYREFAVEHMVGGYKLCAAGVGPVVTPEVTAGVQPRNHSVVSVKFVGYEDCYDITVKEHHNFAVAASEQSGVFVHNSQEDVRFARTVLRIQRELRNGLKKIARVHLASLGINPSAVDYEVYMTVPSAIFELAQLEVRNARADFAGRMSQFVSLHWILQKVFGLSDTEIEFIIGQRHEEALADAEIQAKSMGLQMDVQNQATAQAGATQMQQQQQMAQAQGGQPAAAPSKQQSEDARNYLRTMGSLSRMWPQIRQHHGFKPITEQELFNGNREHEKRVEDNLEKIMDQFPDMGARLNELGHLIKELSQHSK